MVIEYLKSDFDTFSVMESPNIIQEYFYDNFNMFVKYEDCVKIYNYFTNNKELIEEVLNKFDTNNME